MYLKTCIVCDKEFTAKRDSNVKYCGPSCRNRAYKERHRIEVLCEECGESYSKRKLSKQKFCSISCKDKSRSKRASESRYKKRKERQDFLRNYKTDLGCEICGYNEHPAALTYDHIDPSSKLDNVSAMYDWSWEALITEMAKCRVLCANCHNIHSYNQREG